MQHPEDHFVIYFGGTPVAAFEEVAKFRAARKIWAKMMKDLGATDEKAMMLLDDVGVLILRRFSFLKAKDHN